MGSLKVMIGHLMIDIFMKAVSHVYKTLSMKYSYRITKIST